MGDIRDLRRAMRERREQLRPVLIATTKRNADLIVRRSIANMDRDIYSKPPDRKRGYETKKLPKGRSGGKEFKWDQTGNLKREEKAEHQGLVSLVVNRVRAKGGSGGYSHARHNLGLTPGDPRIIPPPPSRERNTDRIAPFRADAIEETKDERFNNYRQGVLSVLRRTKV